MTKLMGWFAASNNKEIELEILQRTTDHILNTLYWGDEVKGRETKCQRYEEAVTRQHGMK